MIVLKKLLQDDKVLDEYTNKFVAKVMKLTSDKVEFEAISKTFLSPQLFTSYKSFSFFNCSWIFCG